MICLTHEITDRLDPLVSGPMSAEEVQDLSMAFKKALIERAMGAELSHHLGYQAGEAKPAEASSNQRNGVSAKTVLTDGGPVRLNLPRDRDGSFEPLLIPKHERRFTGFDDKIVAMYARGMTVREIQGFLAEQYGTDVSPEFISSVIDAVISEVTAWQADLPTFFIPTLFGNWRWLINTSSSSQPSVPASHSRGWNGGGLRYSAVANPQ